MEFDDIKAGRQVYHVGPCGVRSGIVLAGHRPELGSPQLCILTDDALIIVEVNHRLFGLASEAYHAFADLTRKHAQELLEVAASASGKAFGTAQTERANVERASTN